MSKRGRALFLPRAVRYPYGVSFAMPACSCTVYSTLLRLLARGRVRAMAQEEIKNLKMAATDTERAGDASSLI
jgi:hypothetical protein